MPTYSYHCNSCGHDFEAVQRFADDPLTECPECGSAIRRVIQPVGVVFKGSGWYITDSRPKATGDGDESRTKTKPDKSDGAGKTDKADGAAKTEKAAEKTPAKVAD